MNAFGFGVDRLGWTDQALADLHRLRGWSEPAIEELELTYDERTGRVGFPIRNATLDDLGTLHYRPDPARRNGRPKMEQPAGVERQLSPPPETIRQDTDELLLTKGEPDQVAAQSAGFAAVGVPGVGGWKLEYAARFSGRRWKVYVVGDCDRQGRDFERHAAALLVAAGVDARIVDLDPSRDDRYDLTDYLLGQGADALRELLAAAEPYEPPREHAAGELETIVIVTAAEFAAVDEPGAGAIVGTADLPLIPQLGNVMGYGDGGVGKTTLFVDLGYHVAAGDDWLTIPIPKTRRVLVVECEGPWAQFTFADPEWRRVRAAWKTAELAPIGLHAARHTAASVMIAAGVNVKALSEFIGHSSIVITLDRYGHLLPGSIQEAAGLLDAYLERPSDGRTGESTGEPR